MATIEISTTKTDARGRKTIDTIIITGPFNAMKYCFNYLRTNEEDLENLAPPGGQVKQKISFRGQTEEDSEDSVSGEEWYRSGDSGQLTALLSQLKQKLIRSGLDDDHMATRVIRIGRDDLEEFCREEKDGQIVLRDDKRTHTSRPTPEKLFSLTLVRTSQEFNKRIWSYYNEYIYNEEFKKAQDSVFETFRRDMEGVMNSKFRKEIKEVRPVLVGSYQEGTYINDKGFEFDVNIVMDFERGCVTQESREFPGYITVHDWYNKDEVIWTQETIKTIMAKLHNWDFDFLTESVLKPMVKAFGSELSMVRNFIPNGPAVRIEVKYGPKGAENEILYTADIAAVFEIPQKVQAPLLFVAKGPSKEPNLNFSYRDRLGRTQTVRNYPNNEGAKDMMHRVSTSNQETEAIQILSANKRAVLRICKQMLHGKNYLETPCGVEVLDSYYLKNAFLHEVFSSGLTEADWGPSNTTLRVINMWKRILQFLSEGKFPAFFSKINLLESVPYELRVYLMDKIATFLSSEDEFWQCFAR